MYIDVVLNDKYNAAMAQAAQMRRQVDEMIRQVKLAQARAEASAVEIKAIKAQAPHLALFRLDTSGKSAASRLWQAAYTAAARRRGVLNLATA